MGIGGLLLGERAGAQIRILDSIEIPCSHAFGPPFTLTPAEKAGGRELVQTEANHQVVGWYCSRTRGQTELTAEDVALFKELFPAEWQITLTLQTDGEGPVTGAVFFASQTGDLVKAVEHELSAASAPADLQSAPIPLLSAFDEQPEGPRAPSYLNWILTAVAALAIGAAAFEIQNVWMTKAASQSAPSVEIP